MSKIRPAYTACLISLASILAGTIAEAASPTRGVVAAALQGRQECVRFRWETGEKGEAHAGIDIPAIIDGTSVWLQLDTGADYDVIYGKLAAAQNRTSPGAKSFRPTLLRIGGTVINHPYVSLKPEIKDQMTSGTFGLADLIGRVAVLDYAGEIFCIFAEPVAPRSVTDLAATPAVLRNGKLFLPVRNGQFSSDSIVFDTGSSQFPLIVDQRLWQTLTGVKDAARSSLTVEGSSWGTPVIIHGAPSLGKMSVDKIELGQLDVYTLPDPDSFAHWPFKTEGIVGNAPFLNGLVVLDMTARVAFGYAPAN